MAYMRNNGPAKKENFLEDYIPVSERLQAFYEKFEDGSIQTEIVSPEPYDADAEYIVIRAYAYRNPEDPRPAIGTAKEIKEGYINDKSGSMLENCETSAVGRALAFLGIAVTKGVASKEEIKAAQRRAGAGDAKFAEAEPAQPKEDRAAKRAAEVKLYGEIAELHEKLGVADDNDAKKALLAESKAADSFQGISPKELQAYEAFLRGKVAKGD